MSPTSGTPESSAQWPPMTLDGLDIANRTNDNVARLVSRSAGISFPGHQEDVVAGALEAVLINDYTSLETVPVIPDGPVSPEDREITGGLYAAAQLEFARRIAAKFGGRVVMPGEVE